MTSESPFVDRTDGSLDTDQILVEAVPLAKLIALFAAVAFVPFAIAFLLGLGSGFGLLFSIVAQFVLAVGTGVVLMYVVARGLTLSEE